MLLDLLPRLSSRFLRRLLCWSVPAARQWNVSGRLGTRRRKFFLGPVDLFALRNFRKRRVLAQLQCADVSRDTPAIFYSDLRCIVRHGAEAVGHHAEKMSDRDVAIFIIVP